MNIKYFIFLFFLVFLSGCEKKSDKLSEFIQSKFPDLENGEILVLPGTGCSGCITDAENSIDSLLKIPNFKILFSRVESLKTLKNRLKDKNISPNSTNIFIDTADLYIQNSKKYEEFWSYPTKIIIKDKSVIKVDKL